MLGVPPESAIESAGRFGGVARRLEHKGSAAGVDLYDDYAHVPGEIRATIAALRQRHPGRRIVAAFQPNRFHRVRDMHAGFGDCFDGATVVVIADIYASGTAPIPGVTGRLILDSVRAATAGNESVSAVLWAPGLDDVIATLSSELRPGDVCVGMGCGDIGTIAERLLSALADHDEQRESR
jgi:UDP-N-acetylmuramate--alanine ligase